MIMVQLLVIMIFIKELLTSSFEHSYINNGEKNATMETSDFLQMADMILYYRHCIVHDIKNPPLTLICVMRQPFNFTRSLRLHCSEVLQSL